MVGCGRNDNENFFDVWQYKPSIKGGSPHRLIPVKAACPAPAFQSIIELVVSAGALMITRAVRIRELVKPDNTGADDLNSAEDVLSIFPEPSSRSGPLTVRIGSNDLVHAQLLDLHGCEVERWTFKRETQLHLSNLAPGVYVIRWRTAGSTGSKRVILN
ncbi:MAG: T9SS type A sorting domain-containing protein [Flavobacteriales bacterium]|nr:T9SS type A sorting domain-containing protein [Flavobacteriales bacterium]